MTAIDIYILDKIPDVKFFFGLFGSFMLVFGVMFYFAPDDFGMKDGKRLLSAVALVGLLLLLAVIACPSKEAYGTMIGEPPQIKSK